MKLFTDLRHWFDRLDQRDRLRFGVGIAIVLLLAVIHTTVNDQISRLGKRRTGREADLAEMMTLKQRFLEARVVSQKFANRLAATKSDDSPARVIEEIGIKGKSSSIHPIKGETQGGFVEDAAEVRLEGVTANEAVNLLYRLEKGTRPVVIHKALIKSRFDDPSRLDLTLTIALLKATAPGNR